MSVRARLRAKTASIASDPFRLGLATLIVLTTSRIHQHFPILAATRPVFTIAVVALMFSILNRRSITVSNLTQRWPMRLVWVIAFLACCSVLFGISQGRAGKFVLEEYSKVLIGAALVAGAMRSAKDLRLFVWAFVIGSGILSYLALFVFKPETIGGLVRLGGGYTYDANDIGCVLAVGFPLTLLTLQTGSRLGKVASAVIVVGIGMTIAMSGSRGAFLGFTGIGLWLLVMLRGVALVKRIGFVAVVAIALIIKAPPGYWNQMKTLLAPKDDYNWTDTEGRREVAKRGIGYMLDYPVFGIGVSNFPMAEGMLSEKARRHRVGTGLKWTAAHNSHLEVAAEAGVGAFLAWVGLLGGGIVAMIRLRGRLPAHWARGDPDERFIYYCAVYLPVSFVGFAITASFVSFAYLDPVYLLTAYVTGVYVSLDAMTHRIGAQAPAGSSKRARRSRAPTVGRGMGRQASRRRDRGGW